MANTSVQIGSPMTLTNDVTYAVAPRALYVYAPNGDKLEFSNNGSNWTAAAASAIPYNGIVSAAFVRSHGADQIVTFKGV